MKIGFQWDKQRSCFYNVECDIINLVQSQLIEYVRGVIVNILITLIIMQSEENPFCNSSRKSKLSHE